MKSNFADVIKPKYAGIAEAIPITIRTNAVLISIGFPGPPISQPVSMPIEPAPSQASIPYHPMDIITDATRTVGIIVPYLPNGQKPSRCISNPFLAPRYPIEKYRIHITR